ncbi:MAG: hypothetical protein F4089_11525 [Gammaproteobacteria bacterium]|nr:hypothetical protein [Gammaproteobacteria bacterium]
MSAGFLTGIRGVSPGLPDVSDAWRTGLFRAAARPGTARPNVSIYSLRIDTLERSVDAIDTFGTCVEESRIHRPGVRSRSPLQRPSEPAAVYLKALAAEGVLEEIRAGRENLYINPPLLALPAGPE